MDNAPNSNSINELYSWNKGGIKTPFTLESTSKSMEEEIDLIRNQSYSNWDTFKNSAKLMWEDTTLGVMNRHADVNNARRTKDRFGHTIYNPLLSREEANLRYQQYGVTFSNDIRQNEAEIIAAKKIRETALKQRLQQTEGSFLSGASSLLGGFAGAMLDPINIATAYIPVTKVLPALKGIEAAGFWGKVAVRGADGMIMNSLVEPLPLWMAGVDQRDYSMADSLFNITAGGVFGAGIGGFTDGVRLLGKGEKFNSGVAAAIDFANNRGLDNLVEFQKKSPAITSFAYDDLINVPIDNLIITKGSEFTSVRLNETGPLSKIVGYGVDVDSARVNLRERIGAVLDDDNIFSGYRIDDALDNFYNALYKSGNLADVKWFPKWLNTLQKKAINSGVSFEEYIAKNTKNFTNFEKILKRAEQSRTMQLRFGELAGDALDDAIEEAADAIDVYAKLKDAFRDNPKQKMDYNTFIGNLKEKGFNQQEAYFRAESIEGTLSRLHEELNRLQKQLDTTEVTTERQNLLDQINNLKTSINAYENELSDLRDITRDNLWKYDADNIDLLESIRAKLEEDPRTFDDVREQLQKQVADESGKTWDTSESILDDMSVNEVDLADEGRVAKLKEETTTAIADIKLAIESSKFTKEELLALGLDKDGNSIDMRRADKRIEAMDRFSQAAEDYASCRRTEGA